MPTRIKATEQLFCVTLLRTSEIFPSKVLVLAANNFHSIELFHPNFCIAAQHLVYNENRSCKVPGELSVWCVLLVGIDFFLVQY